MAEASWQPDPTGRHQYRYWDGTKWTEQVADAGVASTDANLTPAAPEGSIPAPPLSAAAYARSGSQPGTIALLLGAVVIGVGSIGPWAKVSAGIFSRSLSGTDGDGKITIALAIVILLIALVTATPSGSRALLVIAALCALTAGAVGVYDAVNVSDKASSAESTSDLVSASVGWGLYAVIGGAAICIVALAIRANELPQPTITAISVPQPPASATDSDEPA